MKKMFSAFLMAFLFCLSARAQFSISPSVNATQLAQILAGNGVVISNATLVSSPTSAGFFNGGASTNLGVNNGVILTSGSVIDTIDSFGAQNFGISNPVTVTSASQSNNLSDSDLDDLFASIGSPSVSRDATVLEFDILVLGDTLKFNYVFGSEEYTNFTCTDYTDIFGFLIDGPKPGGGSYVKQNIALVPGSTLPVAINTINGGNPSGVATPCVLTNTQYYVDNLGDGGTQISYDGFTKVLTAIIPTIPCTTYHLKLAIADANDQTLDSGVFLQGNSFVSTLVSIVPGVLPGVLFDNAVEGCNASGFSVSINPALPDSFTLLYALGGQAVSGTDYTSVTSGALVFAPGDTLQQIAINPLVDGVFEGNESVVLYLINSCNGQPYDSAVIYIQDTVDLLVTSPDVTICAGEETTLSAAGAISFIWSPAGFLSQADIPNPVAFPPDTTQFRCIGVVGTCRDTSFITVNAQEPGFTLNAGPDDTICKFGAHLMQASVSAGQAPYTFAWSPSTTLSNPQVQQPVAQPLSTTTYQVTATGVNGCTLRDSMKLYVIGQAPLVSITADKNDVCPGDTIQLSGQIFPLTCGPNSGGCSGNFAIDVVGSGVNQFGNSPFNAVFSPSSRTQIIYRAADLIAAGLGTGTITDIALNVPSLGFGGPYNDFTIRMGCTSESQLNQFQEGLTEVVNPYSMALSGAGWNTFSLNTFYDWDGVSNLVVEFCFSGSPGANAQDPVLTETTSYPSLIQAQGFSGNVPGCTLTNGFTLNERPNMQFVWCEYVPVDYTYNWIPSAQVSDPAILNPYVILEESGDYILEVEDSSCTGAGVISLRVNQYGVDAGVDTALCAGLPVGLQATLYGDLPLTDVPCGTTNSPFAGVPVVREVIDSTGFSFTSNTPFNSFYMDTRAQYLYHASDLAAAGLQPGTIRRLGWKVIEKNSIFPFQNFTIKLGCTSEEILDGSVWLPTQTVYNSPAYSSVAGWNGFNLQTPYNWDGVSNLVVEICFDNFQFEFASDEVAGSVMTVTHVSYAQADNDQGCSLSPDFSSNFLPTLSLSVVPAPPVQPFFVWSPSGGLNNSQISNPVASPVAETVYTVEAVFPDGCVKRDSVRVAVSDFTYTSSEDTLLCAGQSALLSVTQGASVSWQPSTGLSCADCFTPTANPTATTTYQFALSDSYGCNYTDSIQVAVSTLEIVPWFTDTLTDQGTGVLLGADVNGGQGDVSWLWTPSDFLTGLQDANIFSTPLTDITYSVVAADDVCTDTAQIQVRVNVIRQPFAMPDAFSPNGDGENDELYPVFLSGSAGRVKAFRVYNRWGELIHDGPGSWNGQWKGVSQPVGVYSYYLVWAVPFQPDEVIMGNVTLIR